MDRRTWWSTEASGDHDPHPQQPLPTWITIAEAAYLADVSIAHLEELTQARTLRSMQIDGGTPLLLVHTSDLAARGLIARAEGIERRDQDRGGAIRLRSGSRIFSSGVARMAAVYVVSLMLVTAALTSLPAIAGGDVETSATGKKVAARTACTSATFDAMLSYAPDRSKPTRLCDQAITGAIFVFVAPQRGAKHVTFFLDGKRIRKDSQAPWDLVGDEGDRALPFDTTRLREGGHVLEARVAGSSGSMTSIMSRFEVQHPQPPPPSAVPPASPSATLTPAPSSSPPTEPSPSTPPSPSPSASAAPASPTSTMTPTPAPSQSSTPSPTQAPSPSPTQSAAPSPSTSPTSGCQGVQVPVGADLQQVTGSKGAGTTFCLAAGTFTVSNGITLQHGDVLQGAGRTRTFIVGTGAKNILRAESKADVTVRALDISGGWGDSSCNPACGRAIEATGSSWLLQDIRCHDNDNQCVGGGSGAVTMLDSECDRNGFGHAFNSDGSIRSAGCIKRAGSGNGRLLVRNSFVHHNGWAGVWCDFCSNGPFIVENSIITDNVSKGVSYEVSGGYSAADEAIVRNNVIQRNGLGDTRTVSAGITCNSCADLTIVGNTFGGNANGRAVGLINAKRGPWGDLYGIVIRDNALKGESTDCGIFTTLCQIR